MVRYFKHCKRTLIWFFTYAFKLKINGVVAIRKCQNNEEESIQPNDTTDDTTDDTEVQQTSL